MSRKEYKIEMYLQFVSGDNPETFYPDGDKLWFEILLDEYHDGWFNYTKDCNGFELPLEFMDLTIEEREKMRDELLEKAAEKIAEMLVRNDIVYYDFANADELINLATIDEN